MTYLGTQVTYWRIDQTDWFVADDLTESVADYDYEIESQYANSWAEIPHSVADCCERGDSVVVNDGYAYILALPTHYDRMFYLFDDRQHDTRHERLAYVDIDGIMHLVIVNLVEGTPRNAMIWHSEGDWHLVSV